MKIKILKPIPVQQQYRPEVGKVYEVLKNETKRHLAYIDVDGTKVGVYTDPKAKECEIVER